MAAEEGGGDWRVDGRVGVYVYVWRAWTGRSDVRGRAVGLALCVGRGNAFLFSDLSAAGALFFHGRHLRLLLLLRLLGHHLPLLRLRHTDKLHFCLLACLLLRRGHRLRTLGVVGVRGAHREGRGGRTSTTHTTGVARRIMRALDPPLRAGAGDVLRVDGRELRTLGVVGAHGAARGDEHRVAAGR